MTTPQPTPGRTRQVAHLWDASLCIQCTACTVACTNVNYADIAYAYVGGRGLPTNIHTVEIVGDGKPPPVPTPAPVPGQWVPAAEKPPVAAEGPAFPALVQCQQCGDAPCMTACPVTPVKAIQRDADGLVITDASLCVKCQLCVEACPYGARWMHPVSQVPQSCMGLGCRALVAAGQDPACVQVCPTSARAFGDLRDPRSSVSQRLQAKGVRHITYDEGTQPHLLMVRS